MSMGLFGVAGLLLGVVIIAVAMSLTLSSATPSISSTTTSIASISGGPTTTSPTALQIAERATCIADAKTVGVAIGAYQATTGTMALPTSAAWRAALLGTYLQSWPTSSLYVISVAGSARGHVPPGSERPDPGRFFDGDVLVTIVASGTTSDATVHPDSACATL
jgi:hypothetical protein